MCHFCVWDRLCSLPKNESPLLISVLFMLSGAGRLILPLFSIQCLEQLFPFLTCHLAPTHLIRILTPTTEKYP